MCVTLRIADPVFNTAISALNTVGMVWNRFARRFIDESYFIVEVHWHWRQPTERRRHESAADYNSARASRYDIAMGTNAIHGGSI